MVNVLEDSSYAPVVDDTTEPSWWAWWDLPDWWSHLNGIGRITWKKKLEAGQSIELSYSWEYYWR
jgi:hypothetical protein